MKEIKFLVISFVVFFFIQTELVAAPVSVPIEEPSSWNTVRLSQVVKLSAKDLQKMTGKKMRLKEKIAFSITKSRMKRWLKKNDDMLFSDYLKAQKNEDRKFSFLWFGVGLLSVALAVPLILLLGSAALIITPISGIALVYGTKQDSIEKGSFWLGLGFGVICLLVLFFIALANMSFEFV